MDTPIGEELDGRLYTDLSSITPEQPVPRMLTSTTAKPIRFARTAMPFTGPDGSA